MGRCPRAYRRTAHIVLPEHHSEALADEADNRLVEAAEAASAEFIVTDDQLVLDADPISATRVEDHTIELFYADNVDVSDGIVSLEEDDGDADRGGTDAEITVANGIATGDDDGSITVQSSASASCPLRGTV